MKKLMYAVAVGIMMLSLSMPALAVGKKAPANASTEVITLNLKGNAAQNQAQINAAILKFMGNCAEINVYSYEVKLVKGNVKAIVVKYT